ncbi:MAG: metallophosphoesterase family protein [Acidimicrobiales bacterium]
MTRVVVVADTHVAAGSSRRLPERAWTHLQTADVILHAGDVVGPELLAELRALAPLHAVLGNNDHRLAGLLPETVETVIDGVRVAMVHDSGARARRSGRLHRRFPAADLVVFGHSHQPVNEEGVEGQRLLNPGSATWKRRASNHALATVELTAGRIADVRLVDLD